MEERKEVITRFVSLGMKVEKATFIAGIPKSTYYYRANGKRKGKSPSTVTLKNNVPVDNGLLVKDMENILGHEFNDYGYKRTTMSLRDLGYCINKKKVYRIMKENHFLFPKKKKTILNKKYVKYTSPNPDKPFQIIEVDIKYIFISGTQRNAYLITLLDTFSRYAPEWVLEYNMKAQRVVELIHKLVFNYNLKDIPLITIRTDNGSQFIAKKFRSVLQDNQIDHEYIHPGTPQENGHIESFHNTVQKIICNRYDFDNIEQAKETFKRFFDYYNNHRIMESILFQSPKNFLKLWFDGKLGIRKNKKNQIFFFREKPGNNTMTPLSEDLCNFGNAKIMTNQFIV